MVTIPFDDLRERIRRRASDLDDSEIWSDDLIRDALQEALEAIASDWRGRIKSHTWEPSTDDTSSFKLPDDFVRVDRKIPPLRKGVASDSTTLQWADDVYLDVAVPLPGDNYYDPDSSSAARYVYVLEDKLYIPEGIDTDETLTIAYEAIWGDVESDTGLVNAQRWVIRAAILYAVGYCLQEAGTRYARTGFYKDRFDSGRPSDNPALKASDWFMTKYEEVCRRQIGS